MNKWTDEQLSVLSASGNILVSASAGSGKTTVMVQKITNIIMSGADVNEVLVLTYTNASAADMRAKIVGKLYELLTANADDDDGRDRLRTQLDNLSFSDIGTMDSFCARLIHENFEYLGVSPTLKLMDEVETDDLKRRVMEKLISDEYEKSLPDFISVVGKMSKIVDDSPLATVLLNVYDASRINPSPDAFKKMLLQSVTDNTAGVYGQKILEYYKNIAADLLPFAEKTAYECNTGDAPNYAAAVTAAIDTLKKIIECTRPEKIVAEPDLCFFPDLRGKNIITDEDKERIKNIRDTVKKIAGDLCRDLSVDYSGYNVYDAKKYVALIMRLVDRFDEEYSAAKKAVDKADFNDLSQYAIRLLSDEKCASAVAEKYKFIFIDEYQDINPLQEEIILKLSRGNTFMVGDGKQGIYAFRNAEPAIMNRKSKAFYEGKDRGVWLKMNVNFRSSRQILTFCDDVFSGLLTEEHGGVDYNATSRFISDGSKEEPVEGAEVELKLFSVEKEEKQSVICQGVYSVAEHKENENSVKKFAYREGVEVANRIKSLIGKPYRIDKEKNGKFTFADIAVLFTSRSEGAKEFLKALADNGVPYVSDGFVKDGGKKYIKQIVTFLRVIDNAYDDISMTGLLLSWFGGMTENDVYKLRAASPRDSVYGGVKKLAVDMADKKCGEIIAFIKKWRERAAYLTVQSLIEEVVEDTGFDAYILASPSGREELQAVRAFVRGIGKAGRGDSVQSFLAYYDMSDKKGEPLTPTEFGNAVKIVTVHGSKGLEYPAVFIARADSSPHNNKIPDIIFDKDLGIGMQLYNDANRSKKPSLAYTAINLVKKKKESDERIRLLYVAMTRAQRFLSITGKGDGNINAKLDAPTPPITAADFVDLLLFAAAKNDGVKRALNTEVISSGETEKNDLPVAVFNRAEKTYLDEIGKVVNFSYAYEAATTVSPKYTVSDLNRNDDDSVYVPSATGGEDNRKKGIAYHAVMENIDFNASTLSEVNGFILSLVSKGILTEDEALSVDGGQIIKCINSPVIKEGIKGKYLREKPFMLRLKADLIADYKSDDSVLIQGTADLILFGNETTVIDFKYSGLSDEKLAEKYKKQLYLYEKAVETAFRVKVDKKLLYSFNSGHFIEIK